MRPLKDGSRSHGEVQRTGVAAIETVFAGSDFPARFALRADDAIGPKAGFEIGTRRFNVREAAEELEGADCASAHWLYPLSQIIQQGLLLCQEKNGEKKMGESNAVIELTQKIMAAVQPHSGDADLVTDALAVARILVLSNAWRSRPHAVAAPTRQQSL